MKINIMTEDMAEFTGQIIDIFDDFLEERGVRIPSSDEEMEENGELEGNDARIYGTDYGFLQEKLEELLDGWAEKNVKAYLDAWLEGWCQCGRLAEEKGK